MPQVANSQAFPYNAIGAVNVTLQDGNAGWGTGTLIGERYVLTCGHNIIYNRQAATSAVFYPGYNDVRQPAAGGTAMDCGFVKRAFINGDRSWDIGLFRLANSVYANAYPQCSIVLANQEPAPEMTIAGFPSDHHFNMWEETELVSGFNVAISAFAYTHATSTGSSGSPLFQLGGNNNAFVYGVHSGLATNLDDKVGILITQTTYGFLAAAMQYNLQADTFVIVIE